MGLRIKEGNKVENNEKDSRNLEQNLEKVGLAMVHKARLAIKSNNLINDAKAGVQHIVKHLDSNNKLLKNIPSSTAPTLVSDDDIVRALAWCEERVIVEGAPAGDDQNSLGIHAAEIPYLSCFHTTCTTGLKQDTSAGGFSALFLP